jgi:RimJ/RimL family protein N-acetyltransferase
MPCTQDPFRLKRVADYNPVMLASPVLEGLVVRLEPLALEHVAGLTEAAAGPRDTYRFTGVPLGEAATHEWVEQALALRETGAAVPFATIERHSGQVAGATRFFDLQFWAWAPDNPHQRGPDLPDAVEIGHTWLAAWAQRTGINTEAKLLMLTHAFELWRVHRVRLSTDARNARSRAAIERLGMRLDGILRAASAGYDGTIRDSAYYSMLDSEWPAAKATLMKRLRLNSHGSP